MSAVYLHRGHLMQIWIDTIVAATFLIWLCLAVSQKGRRYFTLSFELALLRGSMRPMWTVTLVLAALASIPLILGSGFVPKKILLVFAFFSMPTLVFQAWHKAQSRPNIQKLSALAFSRRNDAISLGIALFVFFCAVYKLVPAWAMTKIGGSIPIAYWGMSIYMLTIFPVLQNEEIDATWKFDRDDLKYVLVFIPILFVLIVPLAAYAKFLVVGLKFFHSRPLWQMPIIFAGIFIATAMPEEIFARGVMQKIIVRHFGPRWGIPGASLMFGIGHITRVTATSARYFGYPNWWYVLFATIAGLGYGFVYHKRKSVVAAAALHASVDCIWILVFRN